MRTRKRYTHTVRVLDAPALTRHFVDALAASVYWRAMEVAGHQARIEIYSQQ